MGDNAVYILSKGRPECMTAKTLLDMGYPGSIVIVCGDNDETIPEYERNFGSDMVNVFDHEKWWRDADMMDAYGLVGASGIAPARNYIIELARKSGYGRCWQFDDDMVSFQRNYPNGERLEIEDGSVLFEQMDIIETIATEANIPSVGMTVSRRSWNPPELIGRNVGGVHNVTTDGTVRYRARIFEDAVATHDAMRHGHLQYNFKFLQAVPYNEWYGGSKQKKALKGGMFDQYEDIMGNDDRTRMSQVAVSLVGYATMTMPMARTLIVNRDGTCRSRNREKSLRQVVIREEWRRGDD